jgi:DNA repair exonuclease SbcCD ATPase subunit
LKIVKVEIENFKPYTKVILPNDNNNDKNIHLAEGLFLIHGNNSMGKTSFVQGMLWGLLGDGLMNEQKRKSLVKAGESGCKVEIIFDLSGTQYRIIRKLILKKSKALSNEPDFNEEAVLSKKDDVYDSKFVSVANRSKQVNEEVERMLGVSADIIERTVYIRQKDVDRLALADPRELRELIMTLFGLDEFERVKKDLANMSCDLQDSINILKEEIAGLNAEKRELVRQKTELEKKEQEFNEADVDLNTNKDRLSKLPSEDVLIKIKISETKIDAKNNELQLVNNSITEKTNYIAGQGQRIEYLRKTISDIEGKKAHAEYTLEHFPSKENLHTLNGLLSEIKAKEHQIRTLINRSITLDFDPILQPEDINLQLDKVSTEIEALKKQKEQEHDTVEYFRRLSTSNEVLSSIKKSSIRYIQEQAKCPVCNKPIDNKEKIVLDISQEMIDIEDNYKDVNQQVKRAAKEHSEIDGKIEAKNKIKALFETLFTVSDGLVSHREMLQSILSQYSVKSIYDFLSHNGFSTVEDMISQVSKLEFEIANYDNTTQMQNNQIDEENVRYETYEEQLSQLKDQMQSIINDITQLKNQQQQYLRESLAANLDDLIQRFECKTIDEIIIKRKTMEFDIASKKKLLDVVRAQISSLKDDIKNRDTTITKLEQKEEIVYKKVNELHHVKFLRGEIDGFISNYVVEGRMVGALRQATNAYLTQLTEGRYIIDRISSTMRRIKGGMESHGLEMTLMDSRDNMIKNKDQLSGGDETSLGLALRIAISKLMARVRPFKNSEKKPPVINSIIMDEPMASLDSCRRRILVNMLTQDKSFKQVFLITHTDLEFGDYNSIMVTEDGNGKRLIDYTPLQL